MNLVYSRDELVLDNLAVFYPIIPIFPRTLFKVSLTSMCQHSQEENGVE